MCPVRTSAPASGEGLSKFALDGVRVAEKGREVCVCVCFLCVFLCCTKFRGPDGERKGKREKVKDLNEVGREREGETVGI